MRQTAEAKSGAARVKSMTEAKFDDGDTPASSSESPFHKVNRDTLHDRVYLEIRRAIMSGKIQPGSVVTIRNLAAALDTSTMPVRDALRRLVAERVVQLDSNRSYRLQALTASEFDEILRIRLMLEGMLAERAAPAVTSDDIAHLERLQDQIELNAHNRTNFLELNQEFHFRFYAVANQPVTLNIVESLWLQAGPRLNNYLIRHGGRAALKHHRALLKALRKWDGKAARAAIEADLMDAGRVILDSLDEVRSL
jgi:DNA-binding GntR family transcriptional regulator